MQSSPLITERTKPLLGTYVRVRLQGLAPEAARCAMQRCFAEVALIHRHMSFQESSSDVCRLNREAWRHPVRVDFRTHDVLRLAGRVSRRSAGVFDVTVAPHVVVANRSAAPANAPAPDPQARWSDIELLPDEHVRFRRPLWLDLSGIAKGYAVDRVIDIVASLAPLQACVDAGGDLRVMGPESEWVRLGVDLSSEALVPMVELRNESIASSGSRLAAESSDHCSVAFVDGALLRTAPRRFVSVLASTCAVADALTKVVMARGAAAAPVLQHFGARAMMSEGTDGWREVA